MGCSPFDTYCGGDEKPEHEVEITKGFWLGRTEVTVAAWTRYVDATGKQMPEVPFFNPGWKDHAKPMAKVNWKEAADFCGWVGGRLPTEAEWEYAARAGTRYATYGDVEQIAWDLTRVRGAQEVATKEPNAWGLHDMIGNVEEWVNDWYYARYYDVSPRSDPQGPPVGEVRVLRGGSQHRVSRRDAMRPLLAPEIAGLRCVWD
jgi:formylglycine-generating enzyme required for sulfatase activity